MTMPTRALAVFAVWLLTGAASSSADSVYDTKIAAENASYATERHAMLKIQDSAYLEQGQSIVLVGKKGDAASWRWRPNGPGRLTITVLHGALHVSKMGRPLSAALLATGLVIDKDVDVTAEPTQVSAGTRGWRLFIYNQRDPEALNFAGVNYFPFDRDFIVQAVFSPDASLSARTFPTSRGTTKQFFHVGDARFTLKGTDVSLPLYAGDSNPAKIKTVSAFFTDLQTGKDVYGSGRYLDVEIDRVSPHTVTIDFNQAYNPNCARSSHFTCPIARDNIPIAITVGELDPHLH